MGEPKFVISAGRTGTVFMTEALERRFPQVRTVHEPSGSRLTLIAANGRNLLGVGTRVLRRRFRRDLGQRLAGVASGEVYIEVNPMLCSLTDLVAELQPRVVHLVREPHSWVESIRRFRASGFRRHVIDFVPLATPFPAPRPPGFFWATEATRALWRWRYCNEQILELGQKIQHFATIRYEDLFSTDPPTRGVALEAILRTLELPSDDLTWFDTREIRNPAPARPPIAIDAEPLQEICGPLLMRLGYAAAPS